VAKQVATAAAKTPSPNCLAGQFYSKRFAVTLSLPHTTEAFHQAIQKAGSNIVLTKVVERALKCNVRNRRHSLPIPQQTMIYATGRTVRRTPDDGLERNVDRRRFSNLSSITQP
jgi:hypothetical protein